MTGSRVISFILLWSLLLFYSVNVFGQQDGFLYKKKLKTIESIELKKNIHTQDVSDNLLFFKTDKITSNKIITNNTDDIDINVKNYSDLNSYIKNDLYSIWFILKMKSVVAPKDLYLYTKNWDYIDLYQVDKAGKLKLIDQDGKEQKRFKKLKHIRFSLIKLPQHIDSETIFLIECRSEKHWIKIKHKFYLSDSEGVLQLFNKYRGNGFWYYVKKSFPIYLFGFLIFFLIKYYINGKEKIYLLYVLYLLSLFIYHIRDIEYNGDLTIILGYLPFPILYLEVISYWMTIIFYALFVGEFIGKTHLTSSFLKIQKLIIIFSILLIVADIGIKLFSVPLSMKFFMIIRPCTFILIIFYLVYMKQIKTKYAKYAFTASVLLTGFVFVGTILSLLKQYEWAGILYQLNQNQHPLLKTVVYGISGEFFETIIFFVGLAHREKDLAKEKSHFKMKALIKQLNNHTLNNGYNIIQNYISKNENEKATRYLQEFAHFFRLSLNFSREDFITLQEELKLCTTFLEGYKITNQNFVYKIQIKGGIDTSEVQILPLLLFPFLENSIKHGFGKQKHPKIDLIVTKVKDNLVIKILDNGISNQTKASKFSLGSKISKERLNEFNRIYKKNITFETNELHGDGYQVEIIINHC